MLRALSVPAGNERGPLYMDQALAGVHLGNPARLPVTLAFARVKGEVTLCFRSPDGLASLIEGQLYAQYPEAKLDHLPEEALAPPPGLVTWTADLHVTHDLFPIKRYPQFEDALNRRTADPLTILLASLAAQEPSSFHPLIEVTVLPAKARLQRRARHAVRRLARPFFRHHLHLAHLYGSLALSHSWGLRLLGWVLGRYAGPAHHAGPSPLDTSSSRLHEREEDLQAAGDKVGKLLFAVTARLSVSAPEQLVDAAKRKLREMYSAFGQFSSPRLASFHCGPVRRASGRKRHSRAFLLSTEELATIFHPPTQVVRAATMTTVESRELEPPVRLPTSERHEDLAVLGTAVFRSGRQQFGILPDDRRRHCLLLGKTGQGKSTLLHRLLATDIAAGRGVGLIDPHGDLCDAVLATVPSHRTNDVILFDASDSRYPVSFNIFACPDPEQRPLVASGIIAAFKKLYGEFWGPRMEHILRNAVLALLEVPGSSLLSILQLFSDRRYRQGVLDRVKDPSVRLFWQGEFPSYPPKLQAEAIAPIQNKVGHFASSPLLRNIIGQSRSSLDLRAAMDEGKVLLVNLSKGRIGDDASALLGSFLVTALQLAAMGRAEVPEERRRDFYLSVDEFQNYSTGSFATILSEARKYRLSLTIANQYLSQIPEDTLAAVFGNVGTLVAFQVGAQDGEILAEQLGGELTAKDLLTLPRFHAYVRLLIDGQPSRPFSLETLPPPSSEDRRRAAIIRAVSRRRYARPAPAVEQEIHRTFTLV